MDELPVPATIDSNIKPYRVFTVSRGNYIGRHRIYWNPSICEYYEKVKTKQWRDDPNIEIGDWIESDDGTVAQLLQIMKNFKDIVRFYRFPFTTITAYKVKTGEWKFNRFLASYVPINATKTGILEGKDRGYDKGKYQQTKIRFATYLCMGIDINKAYKLCFQQTVFKSNFDSTISYNRKVMNMLKDEIVQAEIRNQLATFDEKLGATIPEEKLIKHIDDLLNYSVKGSKDHRENIQYIMKLTGKDGFKDIKNIKEAEYNEIKPPEITR